VLMNYEEPTRQMQPISEMVKKIWTE